MCVPAYDYLPPTTATYSYLLPAYPHLPLPTPTCACRPHARMHAHIHTYKHIHVFAHSHISILLPCVRTCITSICASPPPRLLSASLSSGLLPARYAARPPPGVLASGTPASLQNVCFMSHTSACSKSAFVSTCSRSHSFFSFLLTCGNILKRMKTKLELGSRSHTINTTNGTTDINVWHGCSL